MTTPVTLEKLINFLKDKKGQEVDSFAMPSGFYSTFVLVTGTSRRHVQSLAEGLAQLCREHGVKAQQDGSAAEDWVLVEVGDVAVHILTAEKRALCDLESLAEGVARNKHKRGEMP
jgi:ribosome-associated protein